MQIKRKRREFVTVEKCVAWLAKCQYETLLHGECNPNSWVDQVARNTLPIIGRELGFIAKVVGKQGAMIYQDIMAPPTIEMGEQMLVGYTDYRNFHSHRGENMPDLPPANTQIVDLTNVKRPEEMDMALQPEEVEPQEDNATLLRDINISLRAINNNLITIVKAL
jgi:hypothetical protein